MPGINQSLFAVQCQETGYFLVSFEARRKGATPIKHILTSTLDISKATLFQNAKKAEAEWNKIRAKAKHLWTGCTPQKAFINPIIVEFVSTFKVTLDNPKYIGEPSIEDLETVTSPSQHNYGPF